MKIKLYDEILQDLEQIFDVLPDELIHTLQVLSDEAGYITGGMHVKDNIISKKVNYLN